MDAVRMAVPSDRIVLLSATRLLLFSLIPLTHVSHPPPYNTATPWTGADPMPSGTPGCAPQPHRAHFPVRPARNSVSATCCTSQSIAVIFTTPVSSQSVASNVHCDPVSNECYKLRIPPSVLNARTFLNYDATDIFAALPYSSHPKLTNPGTHPY
ncbi:hypothetical protein C8J57DRAFT_1537788 [Mycena rebaudengoi]|nr:hypothetical protein C8J57DRAFT_1537788 [Mycena rebaudengoi]